ncbi:amino acid permease [Natrialbaceae archaeon A-gly3]
MVSPDADTELSRDLGTFAVFTTAAGTMIGAGIFILPGPAAAGAGPSAALSFTVAGTIALVATMCAVELATAMPRAGGPYFFASRAMGPLVGTVIGLGAWLALIFKGSFALVGLGWYVTYFSPVPVLAVAVVGGLLLVVVNWVGAEKSGGLQNLVVIGLVAILAVFAGRGVFAVETATLSPFLEDGWGGVVTTTGLVFISYLGIVKATAIAGEVKEPGTTLPRALLAAVVFVTALYAVIMVIVTGVLPIETVVESTAPVADTGEVFLGALGGSLVALAGILATVSTANAAILSSSRFPFAMARDGLVTPKLRQSSPRFGTPTRSIWLTGLVMITLALAFDVEGLAKLGGTFGILVFALLNVTVVLLRSARPEWYDPNFQVPFSPLLPLSGAAAALLLIPFMGLLSQVSAIAFILLGIAWYSVQTRVGEPVQPDHNVSDQLQRVQYRKALEEKESQLADGSETGPKIVVEVVEGKENEDLLSIVTAFANRLEARLEVVVISEVTPHIPLSEYDHDVDEEWVATLWRRLEGADCEVDVEHVLARDRTDALLELIDDRTELVVVDWHDPIRERHLRESHVDEVLRSELPVRVAVLKHRGTSDLTDIVVATEEKPYDRAEVELADAIAAATDATLTLTKVIPEDASEEAITTAEEYLAGLAELVRSPVNIELIQQDDVRATLIDRGNGADLLVLGAPAHPDRLHDFFGQTTDVVAAETEASVLVANEPGAHPSWYQRVKRRISGGE